MTIKEWTTNYPTSQDTPSVDQPDLVNDSIPGAGDGDLTRSSQVHALRDKLQAVAEFVGDSSNLPSGSLRDLITSVADEKIKITSSDTTSDYLDSKIAVAGGLTKAVLTPAGDETLEISAGASILKKTTAAVNYYINMTSGNDGNDGLTVGTPVRTWSRLREVMTYQKLADITIHVAGTTTDDIYFDAGDVGLADISVLRIEGENLAIVDGPRTADISSAATIGTTGAGWTVNAFVGRFVQILTGDYEGCTVPILSNTTDTLTFNIPFDSDVGPANYQILNPPTFINGRFNIAHKGQGSGIWISNLTVYKLILREGNYALTNIRGTDSLEVFDTQWIETGSSGSYYVSPCSFDNIAITRSKSGVLRNTQGRSFNLFSDSALSFANAGFRTSVTINHCIIEMSGQRLYVAAHFLFSIDRSYVKLSGSSRITATGGSGLGIKATRTKFILENTASFYGSGNTTFGIHLQDNSFIITSSSVTPTLTGSSGDVSFNGTTLASTWAAIIAGTPAIHYGENCLVKRSVDATPQPSAGTDADAIHDNVSGEINAITEKTALVAADLLLIENSASSYSKNKAQVGNLPGSLEPYGFENRADSTISFSDGPREFTIQPKAPATSWTMWRGRYTKIIKTGAETLAITNTVGRHYIYYNGTTLSESGTFPGFASIFVAVVYWDGTKSVSVSDERHQIAMTWKEHEYAHFTIGTRYQSGLSLAQLAVGTGALDTHAQISMDGGTIWDEDLDVVITRSATPTNLFEQELGLSTTTPGKFPIYYRLGATGPWTKDVATNFPVRPFDGVSGSRIGYNLNTGGTWSIADSGTNGSRIAVWIVATTSIVEPVIAIMGQRYDGTLNNALANNLWESMSLGDLPFQESKILFRLIIRTSTSYGNTIKAYIEHVQDLRSVSNLPSGTYVATDHNSLTGRSSPNSHPASAIAADPTNFTNGLIPASTIDVQTALDNIDDKLKMGTGSPEGVVTAPVGSLYLRTDGGTDTAVYKKESGTGNTGWVAIAAGGGGGGTGGMTEEHFTTAGTETPGDPVSFELVGIPGGEGSADTPSGYYLEVYWQGKRMVYAASPSYQEEYYYDAVNNEIDILASGDADEYDVIMFSGGMVSPLTTKGDLFTRNATVDDRIAVGVDGQQLVADSVETAGLKWLDTEYVPDWSNSSWLTQWARLQSYIKRKVTLGGMAHSVHAYAHGVTAVQYAYRSAVLAPNGILYLVPGIQSTQTNWHYINTLTGGVVAYAHGMGTVYDYLGGVLAPNGRIYLVPFGQSDQTNWHYIDTNKNVVVAYAHGVTAVQYAYTGGVLAPNGRIYLVPQAQATQTNWHYIDTTTGNVVAYAHGATVAGSYLGGVLAPNGRIYLIPRGQADETNWHYIDTTTGNVVAYAHGVSAVNDAYFGGVLAPNGRIYLVPSGQATQTNWHYIDTTTGNVVAYAHGVTAVSSAYAGGVLAPNGRIYLVPDAQADQTNWHYIDTTTGNVVAYAHGVTAVSSAYNQGILAPDGRIYLIPYSQANQTNWHFIETNCNSPWNKNLCTNPMFNKF